MREITWQIHNIQWRVYFFYSAKKGEILERKFEKI